MTVRSGYLWLQQCLRSVVLVKWHHAQATLYKKQRKHRHGIWCTSDTTLKWCDHCYRSCPKSRILAHAESSTAMAKQLGIAGEAVSLLTFLQLLILCSLGPYTELISPVLQGVHMPHRPLVWADNVNRTRQHCQHRPQHRGRVSRMSLRKSLWGNHSYFAQHSCQCYTANSCFGFCRCMYKIFHPQSVPLSSFLFGLSAQTTFLAGSKESVKKLSVGWANAVGAPQKVHKLFTKLARASFFYHRAWKQFAFPFHQEAVAQLLHWYCSKDLLKLLIGMSFLFIF